MPASAILVVSTSASASAILMASAILKASTSAFASANLMTSAIPS